MLLLSEKNLPIKMILQNASDSIRNTGGGGDPKLFGDVTPQLKESIIIKFKEVLNYYEDLFNENEDLPGVGKVTVKPEAIAKSHKPVDLCRYCPIVGSEDLDEIYIKVTKKGIHETIKLIESSSSKRLDANLTAILNIEPVSADFKISSSLHELADKEEFQQIKNKIKIKLFDFNNEFDNAQIRSHFNKQLETIGLNEKYEILSFNTDLELIKLQVASYEDVLAIANINGVKSVDFFQEYTAPITEAISTDLECHLDNESDESEVIIGIIDSGIADNHLLAPFIYAREEFVATPYQNRSHGTFIASTILYGNELNGITGVNSKGYRFLDVVAIPNSDESFGPTDSISEDELMEIIENTVRKYSDNVKVWNLSLGIESQVCRGSMSDLGVFLDYIQDKFEVQIFVSSGNVNQLPLREWPADFSMGERDRIIAPADSVRAITVGSVALFDSDTSIVKSTEPSPFSRRGPGANYIVKPDLVDYGGNLDIYYNINGLGMKGLDIAGNVIEGNGTSYSNPRVLKKFADVYDEMVEKDLFLAKGLLIHSARMGSRDSLDQNPDNIKYYGFGIPANNVSEILKCSEDEVSLVFKQQIFPGTHLELYDFPYPDCLVNDGKCVGEIGMTLIYKPLLDQRYGREYCRTNIDVSFGTYKYLPNGKVDFKGKVPLECTWDERYEKSRVENGFKWSPIKSYYREIKTGIDYRDGWKLRIDLTNRNGVVASPQEFVLILTIKDPTGQNDVYSDVVNKLREKGYVTTNLETRQQVRQRN